MKRPVGPRTLAPAESGEDRDYLRRQLITYIGNKRALLDPIGAAVERVKRRLGKKTLRVFDAFAGSGVVSRFLKGHASFLACNDLEDYAAVIGRCYLTNQGEVDPRQLADLVAELNRQVADAPLPPGFFLELYAPRDEERITRDDRVFYTRDNARRLDDYRRRIERDCPAALRDLLLGPLLAKASVHANTAGVFKGFYKNRETKVGQFGGSGSDALLRIRGTIELEPPVLSRFDCETRVLQGDTNEVARDLADLDLVYLDPPYNQHPYGSNYFRLNLLVNYQRPEEVSRVSGIPKAWNRSGYNVRAKSLPLLRQLLAGLDARFLLLSFNDEGYIPPGELHALLKTLGSVEVFRTQYNAFRGSRSFASRSLHVTEQLFLVERS